VNGSPVVKWNDVPFKEEDFSENTPLKSLSIEQANFLESKGLKFKNSEVIDNKGSEEKKDNITSPNPLITNTIVEEKKDTVKEEQKQPEVLLLTLPSPSITPSPEIKVEETPVTKGKSLVEKINSNGTALLKIVFLDIIDNAVTSIQENSWWIAYNSNICRMAGTSLLNGDVMSGIIWSSRCNEFKTALRQLQAIWRR
jgi:hypothetical protein